MVAVVSHLLETSSGVIRHGTWSFGATEYALEGPTGGCQRRFGRVSTSGGLYQDLKPMFRSKGFIAWGSSSRLLGFQGLRSSSFSFLGLRSGAWSRERRSWAAKHVEVWISMSEVEIVVPGWLVTTSTLQVCAKSMVCFCVEVMTSVSFLEFTERIVLAHDRD